MPILSQDLLLVYWSMEAFTTTTTKSTKYYHFRGEAKWTFCSQNWSYEPNIKLQMSSPLLLETFVAVALVGYLSYIDVQRLPLSDLLCGLKRCKFFAAHNPP